MILLDDAHQVLEDGLFRLDAIVRRQAAFRLAERHAAARDDEADAEVGRGGDLIVDLAAVLEDISVVEHRRAAGKRQLGATDEHRGARVLRRAARPDPVMRLEPREEVGVLTSRQVAGEHLIEMMVAVDQAGEEDVAAEVEDDIRGRGQFRGRPDLFDDAVAGKQPRPLQFTALSVHRDDDVGVPGKQCRHKALLESYPAGKKRFAPACAPQSPSSGSPPHAVACGRRNYKSSVSGSRLAFQK